MFWSGETLTERLPSLIAGFRPEAVDCNAYTLTIGHKVYITPTANSPDPGSHTIRQLADGEHFAIPPGQFAFLETAENVTIPYEAMAFISIKASIKLKGLVNISGFHVDPGYSGRLVFTVLNAGPTSLQLRQGDDCFLIWYAGLDRCSSMVKSGPSTRQLDGKLISGIPGRLQSLDDFAARLNKVERLQSIHNYITYLVAAPAIATLIGGLLLWIFTSGLQDKINYIKAEAAAIKQASDAPSFAAGAIQQKGDPVKAERTVGQAADAQSPAPGAAESGK